MIKRGQQVVLEFNQQWLAAYGNQSGPVAVVVCVVCQIPSGLSPLFKMFCALMLSPRSKTVVSGLSLLFHLFGALLLPPRSKTGISSLSPGLLAVFMSSCVLSCIFERVRLRFCYASTGSTVKFLAAPKSDAGLRLLVK